MQTVQERIAAGKKVLAERWGITDDAQILREGQEAQRQIEEFKAWLICMNPKGVVNG